MNLSLSSLKLPLSIGSMLVVGLLGTPTPALSYGAASYSPSTGAYGYTYGKSSASEAMSRANYLCGRSDCRANWVQNQCVAIARSSSNTFKWGSGSGSSSSLASSNAVFSCGASDCRTIVYVCD